MKLEGDRIRLALAIRARREELGFSQADIAARGGPSINTLRSMENGVNVNYQRVVVRRTERVLGWQEGSFAAILADGEPTPIPGWRPPGTPGLPGTQMTADIFLVMLDKGMHEHGDRERVLAEFNDLARSLGLPGRDKLELEQWSVVAAALGMNLAQVLQKFAGYSADDLDLAARPPQPSARIVSVGEGQRRRALAREGELLDVAPGP